MPRFITALLLPCLTGLSLTVHAGQAASNTPISLQMEAGFSFFHPWSSGQTYHSGIGYIKPYGAAEYSCGTGYKEADAAPVNAALQSYLLQHADDTNPLFCVYRLADGDLYTLDVLVGGVQRDDSHDVRVDEVLNVVLGGTGKFQGASGFWVGSTAGRGKMQAIRANWSLPNSILKIMDGYVRLP